MSIVRCPDAGKGARSATADQRDLFSTGITAPEGFVYRDDLITAAEEAALLETLKTLPFKPFEFQGYLGKRRIVSFGWRYDFDRKTLRSSENLPDFLRPLQARAAAFAGRQPEELQQVLINEYETGAGVGWHRDKGMFEDVIGISLGATCRFRFRCSRGSDEDAGSGGTWSRLTQVLEPRSAYIMRGPARWAWEHSVPPVPALRYSVTFRNFADSAPANETLS